MCARSRLTSFLVSSFVQRSCAELETFEDKHRLSSI